MRVPASLVAGLVWAFLSARPAAAQAPGDSVRLTLTPTETVLGTFVSRTPDAWQLSVREQDARLIPAASVRRAEQRVLRSRRELRSKSVFRGMLIGAAAGVVLFATEVGREPGDPGLGGLLLVPVVGGGALYGAGVGWVVGSMLPEVAWKPIR
jgi:hypothetical protein